MSRAQSGAAGAVRPVDPTNRSRWEPVLMRRIAFACLCMTLSGCGYSTWWNPSFTPGTNPHMPAGESENMRRVVGEHVDVKPLTPEPGDIWPGPIAPEPTLQELEQQGAQPGVEQAVPGSPDFRSGGPSQSTPPYQPPPPPARGSSTPPGSNQPPLQPLPSPSPPPAISNAPPARNPAGQVYQTPHGPAVTNGGSTGYQTTTTPGGGSAIIVPNGNGTSTIIHSDGTIETVPTPR